MKNFKQVLSFIVVSLLSVLTFSATAADSRSTLSLSASNGSATQSRTLTPDGLLTHTSCIELRANGSVEHRCKGESVQLSQEEADLVRAEMRQPAAHLKATSMQSFETRQSASKTSAGSARTVGYNATLSYGEARAITERRPALSEVAAMTERDPASKN